MISKVPGNLYLLQPAHHFVLSNSPALFTLLYKGGRISEKMHTYRIYMFLTKPKSAKPSN